MTDHTHPAYHRPLDNLVMITPGIVWAFLGPVPGVIALALTALVLRPLLATNPVFVSLAIAYALALGALATFLNAKGLVVFVFLALIPKPSSPATEAPTDEQ